MQYAYKHIEQNTIVKADSNKSIANKKKSLTKVMITFHELLSFVYQPIVVVRVVSLFT